MLNKKLAEMNENGTLPIFKNYLENIEANPTKVKSLSDFAEDGWYEVTDVDGFEKYLVYHYAEDKKISVRYIFGKTPKIQEANPKGFFGEIADVISVFAYDSTLAVSKLNTEEGSAVKLIGLDTDGNLVEDDIPEGIVVDDALNTESDNAIANAPVATALNEKADTADLLDGSLIPNKALQAKSIEAVSTESGAVQDTPFIYQGTGTANGTSIADTSPVGKHLEKQGNSVVVNQSIQNNDFSANTNWTASDASMSISGGVATFTATAQNGGIYQYPIAFIAGHKYLVISTVSATNGASMEVLVKHGSNDFKNQSFTGTGSKQTIFVQFQAVGGNGYIYPARDRRTEDFDAVSVYFCAIINLTQWFGGDIPQDLLDHPENFFRYYNGSLAYNAGSMENGTGRYLTCGGRNLWDGIKESGSINYNTGANTEGTGTRTKNYIPVIPNRPIFINSANWNYICGYDIDKNYVEAVTTYQAVTGGYIVNIPANVWFIRLPLTGNPDIFTISLYYTTGDSYDKYFPYEEPKVYDTGSEVLRSAGSVKDVKAPDGTITRNVGVVDLGTLEFTKSGSYEGVFYASLPLAIKNENTKLHCISEIYISVKGFSGDSSAGINNTDYAISVGSSYISASNNLVIHDTSCADVTALHNKVNGKTIYYELAEPTTEQGTPFAENIEINDYGTMGWDSEVPQGCKIFYPADYALFIDSVGQRQDINWDALAIVSHTELNNETDALEAKDTQLLNAVGGTLRQLLAVSKSIDFANTAFVDLGDLSWNGSETSFMAFFNGVEYLSDGNETPKILCSAFATITPLEQYYKTKVGISVNATGVGSTSGIRVCTSTSYTDATAFKNAMKGVLLAYEKAE